MPLSSKLLINSSNEIRQILQDGETFQGSVHVEQLGKTKQHRTYYNDARSEDSSGSDDDDSTVYSIASLTKLLTSLLVTIIIDTLSVSRKKEHEQYVILQRFPDPWNTKFTELFNTCSDTQIEDFPGNPTLWHVLIHFNSLPPLTNVLLGPDGTSLMSKESFLQVAPRLAKHTYGNTQEDRTIYSNGNHIIVGLLIEAIAKKPLENVIKEHLFDPLGMTRTCLGAPDSSVTGIAPPFTMSVDGHRVPAETKPYPAGDIMNAALGAYSCCRDIANLFRALLNCISGDQSVFKTETIRKYIRRRSTLDDETKDGFTILGFRTTLDSSTVGSLSLNRHVSRNNICSTYRLGKRQDGKQVQAYYLAGHIEGYSSCYYFMPQWSTFLITLTNTTGLHDSSDHISRFLLQKIFDLERSRRELINFRTADFSKKVDILNMSARAAFEGRNLLMRFAAEYGQQNIDDAVSVQLDGTYVNEDTKLSIIIRPDELLVNIVGTAKTTDREFVRTRDMGLIRTGHDTICLRPLFDAGFTLDRYDAYNWKTLTFYLAKDKANKKVLRLERRLEHFVDEFIRQE